MAFHKDKQFSETVVGLCPCSLCCCLPCWYACEQDNVSDRIHAQHLAITRDGIKYVVDRHDTGCRSECQQQGKVSKTVPYDKMTDCDVEEPAGSSGNCLMLVANTLHVVNVDTASSHGGHELTLVGLVAPEEFKKDVWQMKRGEQVTPPPGQYLGNRRRFDRK